MWLQVVFIVDVLGFEFVEKKQILCTWIGDRNDSLFLNSDETLLDGIWVFDKPDMDKNETKKEDED